MSELRDLIVVGGGVLGLSAAIQAARQKQPVLLIDDEDPHSASRGPGRIFRTKYEVDIYQSLAREARTAWEGNKAFHKCERVVVGSDETGAETRTVDLDSGWIEAEAATRQFLEDAKRLGVEYVKGKVESPILNNGECTGVRTKDRCYDGAKVLVALGAWTPQFFAHSPTIRDRLVDIVDVVVVPWILFELGDEQYQALRERPITVYPGKGEYLPPDKSRRIWVNNARTAKIPDKCNLSIIEPTDHDLSSQPYYSETLALAREFLPELKGAQAKEYRLCKDAITKSQDFLIDAVPDVKRLFIATGGGFHSFKFGPIIGVKIMAVLNGDIEAKYSERWSFASHQAGEKEGSPVHPEIMPEREYRARENTSSLV